MVQDEQDGSHYCYLYKCPTVLPPSKGILHTPPFTGVAAVQKKQPSDYTCL